MNAPKDDAARPRPDLALTAARSSSFVRHPRGASQPGVSGSPPFHSWAYLAAHLVVAGVPGGVTGSGPARWMAR